MTNTKNSFGAKSQVEINGKTVEFYALPALEHAGFNDVSRLPYSLRILLENLLRFEDELSVSRADIEAVARWNPKAPPVQEIAFRPARVLLQDFTGVPCVVDLAAMRDRVAELGGDASQINPLQPVDLVIDHSVQVDDYGSKNAFDLNVRLEFQRNRERYQFLKWGQQAFDNMRVVPPGTGIVHQVNLEYLAQVVFTRDDGRKISAYPDTLVGTDSHTTMINGLGVLGWGVGGIEAEAAMLGQPISMLLPQVVGFKLTNKLREGTTATDLVLRVTEILRKKNVVGKFVEFFGEGMSALSLADRATIANMAPEYGATMGFFPVDQETLNYLRFTGRSDEHVQLVEKVLRAQGLYFTEDAPTPRYSETVSLNLNEVEPSLAGPKRPQDRIALGEVKKNWQSSLEEYRSKKPSSGNAKVSRAGQRYELGDGAVMIAAITSCTNTSNPAVMIGAGLLARNALKRGLRSKPWVKASLAPGSQVVTEYLQSAQLMEPLEQLGFFLAGYGCTTCIGNSGPLLPELTQAIESHDLYVAAVLSGNRNFEGRVHPLTRANYLASPPLVVAYALAGTVDIDLVKEPLGINAADEEIYLRDIWPSNEEIQATIRAAVKQEHFKSRYGAVLEGPPQWKQVLATPSSRYVWDHQSTYIRKPPFFESVQAMEPVAPQDILHARILAWLGDSVTTDHISPAGNIAKDSPAARYLLQQGVPPQEFNSYGSRRGNHEVMVRGTFANIRLCNRLVPSVEGGVTRYMPDGETLSMYDAAMRYMEKSIPLIVIAGKEYGAGSSRDWAAKGVQLLGVRAVIAESFERIHRSNLIGMGVLPLQFLEGNSAEALGLRGDELLSIRGISEGLQAGKVLTLETDDARSFSLLARLDTPQEVTYFRHGGILQFVLRQLLKRTR